MAIPKMQRAAIAHIYDSETDTIAASATTSTGIDKRGWDVLGFRIETIVSASIGADVSTDNSTWDTLEDGLGNHLSFYTASTGSCALSGGSSFEALAPWPYVRLRVGAAQTSGSVAITWVMQG